MTQIGKVDILNEEIEAANAGAERLFNRIGARERLHASGQNSYRVEWAIDIEAASPREAAEIAWTRHMKRDLPAEGDDACVFDIAWQDPDGTFDSVTVDLAGDET